MGNKLYVGNLAYSVRDEELQQAFSSYGAVTSAKVMMDRETGRSKGFGFVEMGTDAEAQAAINGMNGQSLSGRAVVVNEPPARSQGLAGMRLLLVDDDEAVRCAISRLLRRSGAEVRELDPDTRPEEQIIDEIMGFLSAGKGVVVHRLECPNVAEYRKSPERWVPIAWDRAVHGDYKASLRIDSENRPGVLAQIAAAIAETESNIDNVEYRERDLRVSTMHFISEVKHRKHLADVIRRVRRLGVVHGVQRL